MDSLSRRYRRDAQSRRLARFEPKRLNREVQRGRTRVKSNCMRRAHSLCKLLLKTLYPRATSQPPRAKCGDDLVNFRLTDLRTKEWYLHVVIQKFESEAPLEPEHLVAV